MTALSSSRQKSGVWGQDKERLWRKSMEMCGGICAAEFMPVEQKMLPLVAHTVSSCAPAPF